VLPKPLLDLLAGHLAVSGLTAADTDTLVFTSTQSAPLDYSRWRQRVWMPAAAAAGLPAASSHDLRRAAATALVLDGVDLKTAQARLGHSDPRLTLAVYAHATSEADRLAAERLGERFFGAQQVSDPEVAGTAAQWSTTVPAVKEACSHFVLCTFRHWRAAPAPLQGELWGRRAPRRGRCPRKSAHAPWSSGIGSVPPILVRAHSGGHSRKELSLVNTP
jgi:Phage integrase family